MVNTKHSPEPEETRLFKFFSQVAIFYLPRKIVYLIVACQEFAPPAVKNQELFVSWRCFVDAPC
ncbi:hypothetical protein CANARDRAFT_175954 [[Candida] arabinofermentans NRRL YB-2248]|uniref:Uncharacterized protein n=1 Tax=[Candida] arabinofermentans NRRL YB-2248 TaxID=983967 RepID=A0A1E4T152_9ASCO|nr:hypothetical protein CANARDRAFT_175954 [[Candida] arabinofermentans NRRL YB-2248]